MGVYVYIYVYSYISNQFSFILNIYQHKLF